MKSEPVNTRKESIEIEIVFLQRNGISVDCELIFCHVNDAWFECLRNVSQKLKESRDTMFCNTPF